ncbi:Receptor-like protein kinase ANXUR1, partial [Mucuna pruriens]
MMLPSAKGVLLFLVCFSVLLHGMHAAWNEQPGSLILGCGLDEGGANDVAGRQWSPDDKFLGAEAHSITFKASYQDPSLTSEVPYMSARLFTSETPYKFPVQPDKRYWLRLHFYPSLYGSFNPSDSFFSVTANGVTLLANFSASTTCEALSQAYIDREYSLAPLSSDTLTLTFKPSHGSFAYVNGIQLIQMPKLFDSAVLVGYDDQTMDVKSLNLQTMFRLNVGGQYISPTQDSGLTRMWYDDTPYLYGAATGVTNQATKNVRINYQTMPQYIAPVDVYSTSRSMGNDKDVNMGFNLTWIFQVDPNSMYLARLHFCDYYYSRVNEIVFNIFVNNQTAQAEADVIGWTGGKGVPTYKDYAIYVQDGEGDEMLWLALHPAPDTKPEYYDAILNGVEIFKLNDTDLSGPNPQLSKMLLKQQEEEENGFSNRKPYQRHIVIGGAAGGAAGVAFMAAVCVAVYRKKKKAPRSEGQTSWLPIYLSSHYSKSSSSGKSINSSNLSTMAQGLCRYFSLQEIKNATKSFDESNVIGVGGFGKVYKGVIDNGMKVAIKRSNPQSEQGVNEFQTEIEMLSKLRHKHLVSLIGFCEENNEMCLVYDYMALGTMREHLYKGNKPLSTLSWKQRLEICIGAARGLHYLHTGAKYTIIHRDVKTTNILLDENWAAKVSDFGLSKTGENMNEGHVSTVVKGSFGYLDPEYFRRQQLTEKSDVYSFGVVLFEALCARPVLNSNLPKEQVSLAEWALICKQKGTIEDIIDPCLKGKINPESLKKFVDTAEKCLSDHGTDRPSMNDLLWNLEFALNLQNNVEGGSTHSACVEESEFEDVSLGNSDMTKQYKNPSLGSEHDLSNDSSENQTEIFSQLGKQLRSFMEFKEIKPAILRWFKLTCNACENAVQNIERIVRTTVMPPSLSSKEMCKLQFCVISCHHVAVEGDKAPLPPKLYLPLRPAMLSGGFPLHGHEMNFLLPDERPSRTPWTTWQVRKLGLHSSFFLTPNQGIVQYHGPPEVETHDLNQRQTLQGQFQGLGNSLQPNLAANHHISQPFQKDQRCKELQQCSERSNSEHHHSGKSVVSWYYWPSMTLNQLLSQKLLQKELLCFLEKEEDPQRLLEGPILNSTPTS